MFHDNNPFARCQRVENGVGTPFERASTSPSYHSEDQVASDHKSIMGSDYGRGQGPEGQRRKAWGVWVRPSNCVPVIPRCARNLYCVTLDRTPIS